MKYLCKQVSKILFDHVTKELSEDALARKENFAVTILSKDTQIDLADYKDKRAVIFVSVAFTTEAEITMTRKIASKINVPIYVVNIFSEQQALINAFKDQSLLKVVTAFPVVSIEASMQHLESVMGEQSCEETSRLAEKTLVKMFFKKVLKSQSKKTVRS